MNEAAFYRFLVTGVLFLSTPCLSAQAYPSVEITNAPPFETAGLLKGSASYNDAEPRGVAVYINVNGGWYNKPTYANPITPIETNGSWNCNVATYLAGDVYATKYAAFLMPLSASNDVPILDGKPLPEALDAIALAKDFHIQTPIEFSGREWEIKATVPGAQIGPGPNGFSTNNVWTDETGRLHLKINKEVDGGTTNWSCAEVIGGDEFGYGMYCFQIDTPLDDLDPSVVFSPFSYSDHTNYTFREIDIEFTTWNDAATLSNAQYAIQQWANPVIVERFELPPDTTNSVHYFVWAPWRIDFKSLKGHDPTSTNSADLIYEWSHTNATQVPPEGPVRPRINLYLSHGLPPTDNNPVEIIVSRFDYWPLLEFTDASHTTSNTMQLTVQQRVGGLFDLEVATNLAPVTNWEKLETNVTGGAESPLLLEAPATNSKCFYRGSLHFP